jgi:6-pyruvoyltetrahydropterin/6-carboxytetrahydropterin synthase
MTHKITLERNRLRFAAAHFTTFGGECEPLHGHNYDLFVEITGALTKDSWVIDFSEAKKLIEGICKELDHKFLLPARNEALRISRSGGEFTMTFANRRYVVPESDVAELDIDNSTAERLAEWFAHRIVAELKERGADNVSSVRVGVEEMPGQAGWFELTIGGQASG